MKLLPQLIRKFPQWAVAISILILSMVLFTGWQFFRNSSESKTSKTADTPPVFELDLSQAILCGNSVIDRNTGKVIAREWLDGLGSASIPPIAKVLRDEKLVIIAGTNGAVCAFGFDGKQKPLLKADGKPVVFAAFDREYRQVVFPRAGNLCRGAVDWKAGQILDQKKFTDTGYFNDNVFRGAWLWHEDDLLVSLLGKTLEVELDGSVKEVPIRIDELQRGMGPDGSYAVVASGSGEVGVVDLMTGKNQKFPNIQGLRKLLWLTPRKLVMFLGHDLLAEYNHDLKKLKEPQKVQGGVRDICCPSPDGACFLVVGAKSIFVFDILENTRVELGIQFNELEWIDAHNLLGSCNAVDTKTRGLWLVKKSGAVEKISNQPIDSVRQSPLPVLVRADDSAYFVSGGNLWRFQMQGKTIVQLTQGEKLLPQLRLLSN